MNILKFISLFLLFGFASVAMACGEIQEGKRIKPIYPIVGMSYSEFSETLLVVEESIGNEKILNISFHNSECLYVKTGKVLDRLKGSGKSYVFQKINGNWVLTKKSSWLS